MTTKPTVASLSADVALLRQQVDSLLSTMAAQFKEGMRPILEQAHADLASAFEEVKAELKAEFEKKPPHHTARIASPVATKRQVPEHVKAMIKANQEQYAAAKAALVANGYRGKIVGGVYHPE